jgi:hypothetical protein
LHLLKAYNELPLSHDEFVNDDDDDGGGFFEFLEMNPPPLS